MSQQTQDKGGGVVLCRVKVTDDNSTDPSEIGSPRSSSYELSNGIPGQSGFGVRKDSLFKFCQNVKSLSHMATKDQGDLIEGQDDLLPNGIDNPAFSLGGSENHDSESDNTSTTEKRPDDDENSVCESIEEAGPEENICPKQGKPVSSKSWNVFRNDPDDDDGLGMEKCFDMCRQVFTVLSIIVIFLVLLTCVMITTATLIFVTSQLRPQNKLTLECSNYKESKNEQIINRSHCVALPRNYETDPSELTCIDETISYPTVMCNVVTIQWIWCVVLILATPQFFVFIRCLRRVCFRGNKEQNAKKKKTANSMTRAFIFVFVIETLYVTGVCLFMYRVLPLLDNVLQQLILMTAVSTVPAFLQLVQWKKEEDKRALKITLNVLAFMTQLTALVAWPVAVYMFSERYDNNDAKDIVWSLPISLLLISIGWAGNYFDKNSKLGKYSDSLVDVSIAIRKRGNDIYLWISLWKMTVIFLLTLVLPIPSFTTSELFDWNNDKCGDSISSDLIENLSLDWVWVWLINISCGLVAYFFARTAAKVRIQRISYAIPLLLSTPFLFGILVGACELWNDQPCIFKEAPYMYFSCYKKGNFWDVIMDYQLYMGLLWWLSQTWITRHIWFPRNIRLAKTSKIFVVPLYDNLMIEQWLLHNRNQRDDQRDDSTNITMITREQLATMHGYDEPQEFRKETSEERRKRLHIDTPMIYICATMWHESTNEMVQMLKSMFKLDVDQNARRNAQEYFKVVDPDYYQFEAHIFFDDAMDPPSLEDDQKYTVNNFVKTLCSLIERAAWMVHKVHVVIAPPVKYPAPYGGRLVWTMPGGNTIVAHLKDKTKIRHKKRWSQVMYLYYFLGHRLWASEFNIKRKARKSDNTFLLALDGDVDFDPKALSLLVDLMKKNTGVGAACGRIHPIGSGPMVWYQKFEYALGHWMQKATEHVLGSVLCSPGCFSLFRGSALMHNNVMRTYTTRSTNGRHFVQYDQGEDRWLCTLLIQAGFRVEYCAASDSHTYAPEGFNEFYNQRRRWTPSTMANILDVLLSWKRTTRVNDDVSCLYIIYQGALWVSSIFGPGTIFLMITGALVVALNEMISMGVSFIINLIPVCLFIILCFVTKSNTQLMCAMILTGMYALLQMLVLIGILIVIAEDGMCSPTAIFFFYVTGTFVFAALLHPQEFLNIIHGFIYFLAIPSMYMLLMIYAFTNMHVVSWGTREVKLTKSEVAENEERKKREEEKKNSFKNMLKVSKGEEEGFTIGCGSLCRCMCCPREKPPQENAKYDEILKVLNKIETDVDTVAEEVDSLGNTVLSNQGGKKREDGCGMGLPRKPSILKGRNNSVKPPVGVLFKQDVDVFTRNPIFQGGSSSDDDTVFEEEEVIPKIKRDEMINPSWIEDESLGTGPIGQLTSEEIYFFEALIKEYLYPLEQDPKNEERVQMELIDLRNKVSSTFLMANAILVVMISVLQMNSDILYVPWPCGDDLKLEPLGFTFLIFFMLIMMIQTIGMVIHRIGTFLHLMATTTLTCCRQKRPDDLQGKLFTEDMIDVAKDLGRLKAEDDSESVGTSVSIDMDGSEDGSLDYEQIKRENTVMKIRQGTKLDKRVHQTIDGAFRKRYEKLKGIDMSEPDAQRNLTKICRGRKQRKTLGCVMRGTTMRRTPHTLETIVSVNVPDPEELEPDYPTTQIPMNNTIYPTTSNSGIPMNGNAHPTSINGEVPMDNNIQHLNRSQKNGRSESTL